MRILLALVGVLFMACGTTTAAGSRIGDLDATSAVNCEYLSDIYESQYSGMLFAGPGLEGARAKVRNRAAEIGATHDVWASMAAGGAVQAASGQGLQMPEGACERSSALSGSRLRSAAAPFPMIEPASHSASEARLSRRISAVRSWYQRDEVDEWKKFETIYGRLPSKMKAA
jgi:hypothetical protein